MELHTVRSKRLWNQNRLVEMMRQLKFMVLVGVAIAERKGSDGKILELDA